MSGKQAKRARKRLIAELGRAPKQATLWQKLKGGNNADGFTLGGSEWRFYKRETARRNRSSHPQFDPRSGRCKGVWKRHERDGITGICARCGKRAMRKGVSDAVGISD
jgi:hypothetical protein